MRQGRRDLVTRHWSGTAVFALAVSLAMPAGLARGGGLYLSEFPTPDMGTAMAGAQTRASDAATAMLNPAGMTRLDDHQLLLGIAPGFAVVEFDADAGTPSGGGDGGNQGGFVPLLGSAYVHALSDRWRLGLGLVSLAGSALDPDDDWAGRFQMTEISFLTLSLYSTLAFRVTDWLSIGAGAATTYAKLDWDVRTRRAHTPSQRDRCYTTRSLEDASARCEGRGNRCT